MRAKGFTAALSRRRLLQLGAAGGLMLLSGCRRGLRSPQLLAAPGTLPRSWQSQLPSPWAIREPSGLELWPATDRAPVDLVAMNAGWLASVAPNRLQPIQAEPLEQQLGGTARRYLQQLGADQTGRVLPVGVSPWVMLFRNGSQWLDAARQGWDVLLEPDLQGKVVLPASPRFVIELADRMSSDAALLRLRGQLLTMDDRQATNWLLKDEARVVVLPLQRCMALLRRDPRLMAVLPDSGAPLNWTLLVRPADTQEPLPQAWVEMAWQSPLQEKLVLEGWWPAPAVGAVEISQELSAGLRDLLQPSSDVWQRCWSLPPLGAAEREEQVARWNRSTP